MPPAGAVGRVGTAKRELAGAPPGHAAVRSAGAPLDLDVVLLEVAMGRALNEGRISRFADMDVDPTVHQVGRIHVRGGDQGLDVSGEFEDRLQAEHLCFMSIEPTVNLLEMAPALDLDAPGAEPGGWLACNL